MHRRVALLLPNEALVGAAAREPDGAAWAKQLRQLEPLLRHNKPRLDVPFDELDTSGLNDAQREAARSAYAELGRVSRAFPGLRVAALWSERRRVDVAGAELGRRLRLLTDVLARNPGTDFVALDYLPGSSDVAALRLDGLDEDDRAMVLNTVKGFQRVHRVSPDPVVAKRVLDGGFAAGDITDRTYAEFRAVAGLAEAEARQVYERAVEASVDASVQLFAVLDHALWLGDRKTALGSAAPTPEVGGYLRRLGFDELFGVLGGCRCEHCCSVLGPAAYFVDLLHFVEEHLTGKVFTGARANHELALKTRRPDLWTLPLTCANTETLPSLVLVNEILENDIAIDAGIPAGALADRAAVWRLVYRDRLTSAVDSFKQPFVLPLARIAAYLAHFERTRAEIARAVGRDEDVIARPPPSASPTASAGSSSRRTRRRRSCAASMASPSPSRAKTPSPSSPPT